jgi:hypothetical protein
MFLRNEDDVTVGMNWFGLLTVTAVSDMVWALPSAHAFVGDGWLCFGVSLVRQTPLDISDRLKWKRVSAVLTDASVLFWNYSNRANKLYKAMEYDLAIAVYEKVEHSAEYCKIEFIGRGGGGGGGSQKCSHSQKKHGSVCSAD